MYRYILVLLIVALCSFRISLQGDSDSQVMKIAESQLGMYLSRIEPGKEADYGFSEKDDFDLCTVGKPYRIITFNHDFYNNPIQDNGDYIVIQNQWRVPVTVSGQSRIMLDVSGNPGNLDVTAMEGAALAQELQQKSMGVSDSDEFYLLLVPQLSSAFFVHEGNNSFADAEFTPLSSAILAIPTLNGEKKAYSLTEIQKIIKDALGKPDKK